MPSQRIFLLLQRSQAWAMRLWLPLPTLITFMGRIPGILTVDAVLYPRGGVLHRPPPTSSHVEAGEGVESRRGGGREVGAELAGRRDGR